MNTSRSDHATYPTTRKKRHYVKLTKTAKQTESTENRQ